MTSQQIQFAETIRAMKLASRRRRAASPASTDSEDDSDGLHTHTNRGNKLKPSARYAHEGRLDTTGGQAYKRKVNHAGYERHIIAKRPKLYDEDGDVVDPADIPSDADEDERAYGEPIEEDAFGEVRLERLLRPLTSAAELPEHPSLRTAYTSTALTKMVKEVVEMLRKERVTLWKAKRLLLRFRGDGAWMASDAFESPQDALLLLANGEDGSFQSAVPSVVEMEALPPHHGDGHSGPEGTVLEHSGVTANGDAMDGIEAHDHVAETERKTLKTAPAPTRTPGDQQETEAFDNNTTQRELAGPKSYEEQAANPIVADLAIREEDETSTSGTIPSARSHAMTTRARASSPQLPSSPSPSPSDSASVPAVNPWYLITPTSLTDRDLGLPANEAEETRKMLLLYVQKQENIVRQLETIYSGLQRTDRVRREVYRACKAEAHMVPDGKGGVQTEMSDGEDWYDPEDWHLQPWELKEGKLEKGKDEVEDPGEEEGRRVHARRRRTAAKNQ